MRIAAFVDATGGAIARFVQRLSDALACAHQRFEALEAQGSGEFTRFEAGDVEEGAAQGRLRCAERLGQLAQRQAFVGGLRKKVGGVLDQRDGAGNFVGAAAQARAITVALRFFARAKEGDVAAQRPTRGA